MADVKRLSASKITCYMGCSMAYFLRYVAHEKVPSNVRLVFGKVIHYMLQNFYDMNFKSPDSFANSFSYQWSRNIAGDNMKGKARKNLEVREFELPSKKRPEPYVVRVGNHVDLGEEPVGIYFGYRNLGKSILKRFYIRHKPQPKPVAYEFDFGRKKDDVVKMGDHEVRGAIDRIDKMQKDGKEVFYVSDYKTDKRTPEKDSFILHRHPQFTIYSYIFRKIFGLNEEAILYYHLRSGEVFKTHRSEKDHDYVKRLMDDVADGITKDRFTPFYGFHCGFCDLKVACEGYCTPHHGGPKIDLEGRIKPAELFTDWDIETPSWISDQEEERN